MDIQKTDKVFTTAVITSIPILMVLLVVMIVILLSDIAKAQTCIPPLYQGNVNSTGNCSALTVRWLNKNNVADIDHFTAHWLTDNVTNTQPGSALGDSRHDLYCQYSSTVVITQYLKNGATCSTTTTGNQPHTPSCDLCGGGSGGGIACANAANFRDAQTDDAISVLESGVDMTDGGSGSGTCQGIDANGRCILPSLLLGARVYVGNYEAGLFYASPRQINFWIPSGVPQGIQSVQVITASGLSLRGTVNIQPNGPGVFTETSNGQGNAASKWLVVRGGSQTYYAAGNLPALNPTDRVFLILYGTSIKGTLSTLSLENGRSYDSSYTGASAYPGLTQINIEIPASQVWRTSLGASLSVWKGNDHTMGSWVSNGFNVR